MLVAIRRWGAGASDSGCRKRVMFGLGLAVTKIYIAVEAIDMQQRGSKAICTGWCAIIWDRIR